MKSSIFLTTFTIIILSACTNGNIPAYRWHKVGMNEHDIARQQQKCYAQYQYSLKHGQEAISPEQCMEYAGYYRNTKGNF